MRELGWEGERGGRGERGEEWNSPWEYLRKSAMATGTKRPLLSAVTFLSTCPEQYKVTTLLYSNDKSS